MKNRVLKGKVYYKLLWKLFNQTIAVLGAAVVLVFGLFMALRGKFANFLVQIIGFIWNTDWNSARDIYQQVIRNNIDLLIGATMVAFFFILLRLSMPWFTRYFDQIVSGIDKLAEEADEPIVMSHELNFMETKLNEVKDKLKKRAERAQAEEQRKNDLVVYLAHDIRTPLTSVIGYLSLLDEVHDMPAEQREKYVHITLDKAYRLEKLINEFFEITHYNLQQIKLEKEKIDLYYMLAQMVDEFYPILSERGNTAVLHADENLTAYGDPVKLARVFNNILKNAAAYSYPNTEISISAIKSDDAVVVTIQNKVDTIPKEKLSAIFEKFYRLDEARASDTGGSGLGLSIAKEIVALHGGIITAQSANNIVTFIVSLPAYENINSALSAS